MQITSAKDINTDIGTYLIYGSPGMGKTTLLKFLPGKTLVLDIDRTTRVLQGEDNIDIAYVDNQDTWKQWTETLKELKNMDLSKYDNIAVDNVSELERCMLANLGRDGKNNRVPAIQNYLQVQYLIIDSIRFMKSLNKRLIITAWETTDLWTTEEGQQYNRSYPQINNKILTNFMGLCDVVGRIMYNKKSEKRGIVLQPSDSLFAKNQVDERAFCLQHELILTEGSEEE